MEKTLAEPLQRALLAQVIEQMPAGVIIAAPNGRILLGNQQAQRIWRHPLLQSEGAEGYGDWKGFRADGTPLAAEEWPLARSLKNGDIIEGEEVVFERGDGTRGVMRVSSAPIRDQEGKIAAGVVTFFDVTRERREQDALRFLADGGVAMGTSLLMEDTLREAARLASRSFADIALVYVVRKEEIERFEVAAHDDEGRRMLLSMWDQPRASAAVRKVVASGEPLLLTDIRDYQEAVGAAPRYDIIEAVGIRSLIAVALGSASEPFGAMMFLSTKPERRYDDFDVVVAQEIARRASAAMERNQLFASEREHRLRAERVADRLEHLQKLSSALAAALTMEDVAAAVIAEAREIVGASIIVIARRESDQLKLIAASGLPPEIVEQYRTFSLDSELPLAEAVRTHEPVWLGTVEQAIAHSRLFRDTRRTQQSRAWAALPLISNGEAAGAIGFSFPQEQVFSDDDRNFLMSVTSQCGLAFERARLYDSERRARQEAEQASHAKDDFLAILSHELRTPMTTVIGWADFLKMTHGDDESIAAPVESLRTSARAQARLVDDLLDVSRIVTGKLRIERRDTDLRSVIRSAIDEVRVSAQAKKIDIQSIAAPEPLPIHGDPDRLRQVFTNLLGNAVKFTPSGGHVRIRAVRRGVAYEIVVEDSGEGISPDFLPHVFDRFRQASIGDSRRHAGLGLGLSIVQHIVLLHGGQVRAESDGPGKGARFTVTLPAPD